MFDHTNVLRARDSAEKVGTSGNVYIGETTQVSGMDQRLLTSESRMFRNRSGMLTQPAGCEAILEFARASRTRFVRSMY